jgi:hypothetical protein
VKPDTYTIYARIIPAVVTLLPVFVLWYSLAQDPTLVGLGRYVLGVRVLGSATVGAVLLYVFAHIVRQAGLWLERRYFHQEAGFPTTYLLQRGETFSDAFLTRYRERVHEDFGIALLEAAADRTEAKRRLDDAARLVLKRAGNAPLVQKHNTWYGLYRNLVGGAYWGSALAVVNVVLSLAWLRDPLLLLSSAGLGIVFLLIMLRGRALITRHGEAFARQLLSEYVASNRA